MKKISIVIPAMNEEKTLPVLLEDLKRVEENLLGYAFENIVVDDHSTDSTSAIALAKSAKLVKNTSKPGKGNALKRGFKEAGGDFIFMMDADYSHRPEDIPLFLGQLEKGAGLVIGSRILGGSEEYTRVRAFGNIFLTWMFGFLTGRYLSDALNGYKAFTRDLVDKFQYSSNNYEIEIELIVNALRLKKRILEIPSHERARKEGRAKSKVVKDGMKFFLRIIAEKIKGGF